MLAITTEKPRKGWGVSRALESRSSLPGAPYKSQDPLMEGALPAAISPIAVLPDLPLTRSLILTLCAKSARGSAFGPLPWSTGEGIGRLRRSSCYTRLLYASALREAGRGLIGAEPCVWAKSARVPLMASKEGLQRRASIWAEFYPRLKKSKRLSLFLLGGTMYPIRIIMFLRGI